MLERVLLDANAILNGAFIPQSWSRLVVAKLVERKAALYVGSRSLGEAVAESRRIAGELRKQDDPASIVEEFVRRAGVIEIPPSAVAVAEDVPAHDRHVVQDAISAGATILTSDAKLWAGCRNGGYDAVVPLEALRTFDGMSLATTAFGVAPARHQGSIFARVYPGDWAKLKDPGQFTVADLAGRLWLHYCTNRRAWIADMPEVGRATMAAEMQPNTMQTVAVSWEARKGLRLRVASLDHPVEIRMRQPLGSDLIGSVTVGIHASRNHSWNGAINVCVINDRPIGSKLWATLRAPSILTPNPYDSDRLRQAINALVQ